MYVRGMGYYQRGGMSAYPGPRARLRGLRGLAQDDSEDDEIAAMAATDVAATVPASSVPMLTPDQIAALSPSAPLAPSGSSTGYPSASAPNITGSPALSTAQISALSTSQPSALNATVGGSSIATWAVFGIIGLVAISAFSGGARRK